MVGMDLPWCRSCPCLRWWLDPGAHAPKHHPRRSPPSRLGVPCGREYLVPPTGRVLHGILGYGPYYRSLCQLLQRRANPYELFLPSPINVLICYQRFVRRGRWTSITPKRAASLAISCSSSWSSCTRPPTTRSGTSALRPFGTPTTSHSSS